MRVIRDNRGLTGYKYSSRERGGGNKVEVDKRVDRGNS